MINKLKSQRGSAMQVAIIAIVLVGIGGAMITSMVINQIKSTHKASQTLDLKYDTEAGVEEVIGDFIDKINAKGFKKEITEFNIIKLYVELADELVKSNGIANTEIQAILNKIGNGETINKSEIDQVKDALQNAIDNEQGKSNPHADQLLTMALKYTEFIESNLFDTDGNLTISGITFEKSQSFIDTIIYNLAEVSFDDKELVYGNISVAHRDTQCNSKDNKNMSTLDKSFICSELDEKKGYITKKIRELTAITDEKSIKEWIDNNADAVIEDIEKTNYTNDIDKEINLIEGGGYLDTSEIRKLYKTTGDITDDIVNNIVKDRLEIIKLEIDMLIDWIKLMQNLKPDGSGGTERLIIEVPKGIEVKNNNSEIIAKTVTVEYDNENKAINEVEKRVELLDNTDSEYIPDFYRFEILEPPSTKVVLNLDIIGQLQEYKIEAKVDVEIHDILNKDKYEVDYEVKDWKKINTP